MYLVFAWGASLGLADLLPTFDAPPWATRASIIALFALTPVVAALAWFFEITNRGVIRDPADQEPPVRRMPSAQAPAAETIALQGVVVRWQDGNREQVRHMMDGFTLGRDPNCEIMVQDPRASREHARIDREENQWVLRDLESRNGTVVDDEPVTTKPLKAAHTLRLGGGDPIEIQIFGAP